MLGACSVSDVPVDSYIGEPSAVIASSIIGAQATVVAAAYLVELTAWSGAGSPGQGIMPVSGQAVSSLPDGEEGISGIVTLLYADIAYTSLPTDQQANLYYEPRCESPLTLDRQMPLLPTDSRRVMLQLGTIDLLGGDGGLDGALAQYAIDGRQVRVLLGPQGGSRDVFCPIFTGSGLGWEADGDTVRISVQDASYRVAVQLQQTLYGGTGGADGGMDVAGNPLPIAFGILRNLTPTFADTANLIFQCHFRAIQSVDAAYDQGVALTYSGHDYATYALLAAATVSAGQYSTCLAFGLVRLGATPTQLTLDIHGDAVGGYISDTASIVKRILTDFGGLSAGGDLAAGTFTSLSGAMPAPIGWYSQGQPVQIPDVINALMAPIAGWWGPNRSGQFEVGRLTAPNASAIVATLTYLEIVDLQRAPPQQGVYPPAWRARINYQRNWTVQNTGNVAQSVSAARKSFLGVQSRTVAAASASTLIKYALAVDFDPVDGWFDVQADASTEVARQIALYAAERQLFDVTVKWLGHQFELGRTLLISWPRYGLSAGRPCLIVGMSEDASAAQVVLRVWG